MLFIYTCINYVTINFSAFSCIQEIYHNQGKPCSWPNLFIVLTEILFNIYLFFVFYMSIFELRNTVNDNLIISNCLSSW